MKIIYAPPSEEDIRFLSENMSETDKAEVLAYGNRSPEEALRYSIAKSWHTLSVYRGDELIAIYGCGVGDYEGLVGTPWLLSTGKFHELPTRFFRDSKDIIAGYLSCFDCLIVDVHTKNTKSVYWLKSNGFEMINKVEMNGEYFYTMEVRNGN